MKDDFTNENSLPLYSEAIYGDIYNSSVKSRLRDTKMSVFMRSFGQNKTLVDSLIREIKVGSQVLQTGLSFGNELEEAAFSVGAYGQFDIIDINPTQIELKAAQLQHSWVQIQHADATNFKPKQPYDTVICWFLLSELPIVSKMKAINTALASVCKGGKVVFVDWHNPRPWHPLRYVVRMINRLYNPFVEKLWDRDIETFAHNRSDFLWRKTTYFGGMFQKLVAIRKENPLGIKDSAD